MEDRIKLGKLFSFRLKEGRIERELYLILHKDKFISNNMKKFIEYSKNTAI